MFAAERHEEIARTVSRERRVNGAELARRFEVTMETIRRDLAVLESQDRLRRVHGGAVSVDQSTSGEQGMDSRQRLARQEAVSELERDRASALEERARIARDLHDVVAHHMSLIVVQSQTAPYRVGGLSEEAKAEFDSIAGTAREALGEVRVMLGVLRSESQPAERDPQPGVAQLRELIAGSARAGVPVRMEVEGDTGALGMAAAVVLYRIVQESLANATRHAPGAQVDVRIAVGAESVTASVDNAPPARPGGAPGVGGGSGIRGMRERAGAVGGTLLAETMPDGGFSVLAELPLGGSASGPRAAEQPAARGLG